MLNEHYCFEGIPIFVKTYKNDLREDCYIYKLVYTI